VHPDRTHALGASEQAAATVRFSDLNTAYSCLRQSRARLLHLLTLERGEKPSVVQQVPEPMMALFLEVIQMARKVDLFLEEKRQLLSAVAKAARFKEGLRWRETLGSLRARMEESLLGMEAELRELNPVWEAAPPIGTPQRIPFLPLDELEAAYRQISFLTRWADQMREQMVKLTL
jgi:hypothetical protein